MSEFMAYGVDMSRVKFKKDAAKTLWEKAKDIKWVVEEYTTYCEDNDLDPNGGFGEQFVEDYQNDEYMWDGVEGFLCDVINAKIRPSEEPFSYDDYCLYVSADVPYSEADRDRMLTQTQIRDIFCEYLDPLIEEPAICEWLVIHE